MSLGLGDLNRKRRSSASKTKNTSVSVPFIRSRTARPWSDSGLSRPNRRRLPTDGAMTPEWLEAYSSPLLSFEFLNQSPVLKLQAEILDLEEAALNTVLESLTTVRAFLGALRNNPWF